MDARLLSGEMFKLSKQVRYVAVYTSGELSSEIAPSLKNASSSESDKYEELLVNPTLLFLARQRGNIDCGGCQYLIIRYGSFFEFVRFLKEGHLSVGIQPEANIMEIVNTINSFLTERGE